MSQVQRFAGGDLDGEDLVACPGTRVFAVVGGHDHPTRNIKALCRDVHRSVRPAVDLENAGGGAGLQVDRGEPPGVGASGEIDRHVHVATIGIEAQVGVIAFVVQLALAAQPFSVVDKRPLTVSSHHVATARRHRYPVGIASVEAKVGLQTKNGTFDNVIGNERNRRFVRVEDQPGNPIAISARRALGSVAEEECFGKLLGDAGQIGNDRALASGEVVLVPTKLAAARVVACEMANEVRVGRVPLRFGVGVERQDRHQLARAAVGDPVLGLAVIGHNQIACRVLGLSTAIGVAIEAGALSGGQSPDRCLVDGVDRFFEK